MSNSCTAFPLCLRSGFHSAEGDGIRVKGLLFLSGFDFSPDISDKSGMNFVATAEKRVAKFANHRHFLSPEGFPK